MKTTLELPDQLFRTAEATAAERGRTTRARRRARVDARFRQLKHLREETARVLAVIDQDSRSCVILDTIALSAFADGEPAVGTILSLQQRAATPVRDGNTAAVRFGRGTRDDQKFQRSRCQ